MYTKFVFHRLDIILPFIISMQYAYKGTALTSLTIHPLSDPDNSVERETDRDETKAYLDGRYLCAPEAFWRLMGWATHCMSTFDAPNLIHNNDK